jgi:hypothetical protein
VCLLPQAKWGKWRKTCCENEKGGVVSEKIEKLGETKRAHRKRPAMIAEITVPDGKTGVAGIPVTDSG